MKKFVVVGGGWVVKPKVSVLLWSKHLTLKLKLWIWTKPNNKEFLNEDR